MTTQRLALIIAIVMLADIGSLTFCGITGSLTDSEPPGLYIRIPKTPARGDMVELIPLMKHLAGVPGDIVRVTPNGSYINGKLWPNSAPLPEFHYRPYAFGVY